MTDRPQVQIVAVAASDFYGSWQGFRGRLNVEYEYIYFEYIN